MKNDSVSKLDRHKHNDYFPSGVVRLKACFPQIGKYLLSEKVFSLHKIEVTSLKMQNPDKKSRILKKNFISYQF